MSVRVVEQAVAAVAGTREVSVRREGDRVVVRWFCGDARSFTPADLREAVANADRVRAHGDVWLEMADSDGRRFAVNVVDGGLVAENSSGDPSAYDGQGRVQWEPLKKALKKAG